MTNPGAAEVAAFGVHRVRTRPETGENPVAEALAGQGVQWCPAAAHAACLPASCTHRAAVGVVTTLSTTCAAAARTRIAAPQSGAMTEAERDEDGFPRAGPSTDGSVYVDEFEVGWVCEYAPELGYVWRSLGPAHRPLG